MNVCTYSCLVSFNSKVRKANESTSHATEGQVSVVWVSRRLKRVKLDKQLAYVALFKLD